METNFASAIKGVIPALVVTGLLITFRPSQCAEAGTGVIQMGPGVRAPSLEMLQTGLEDMLDRLGLTHAQREQVELSRIGLHWEELDEDISVAGLLAGQGDMTRRPDRAA